MVDIDTEWQGSRVETDGFQPTAQIGDGRLVRYGAMVIASGMGRFRRVLAQCSPDLEQMFGPLIPRLQTVVTDRPARRRSAQMAQGGEIFAAIAQQHGPIEFRIAADIVVVAGIEGLAVAIQPLLLRPEMRLAEMASASRSAEEGVSLSPFSTIRIRLPVGASWAASVAPPIPEPTIMMSASLMAGCALPSWVKGHGLFHVDCEFEVVAT